MQGFPWVCAMLTPLPPPQRAHDSDWWEVTLDLGQDLHRVDYVIYDKRNQQYDNNNSQCVLKLCGCHMMLG
jgi:hypothetical protein